MKGHQDNNIPTKELSIMVHLNVEAGRLAGEFQKHHSEFWPLVTILPGCPAML